jgi:hypothetical protein
MIFIAMPSVILPNVVVQTVVMPTVVALLTLTSMKAKFPLASIGRRRSKILSFYFFILKDMCDLSSDLNVVMRKTAALMKLWNRYPYRHNLSCLSLCISYFCLCIYNDLCTDATSLFLRCSASHTHTLCLSLSLSLCYLALFPLHSVLHINP